MKAVLTFSVALKTRAFWAVVCLLLAGYLSGQSSQTKRNPVNPPRAADAPNPGDGAAGSQTILFTDISIQSGLSRAFGMITPTVGSMSEMFGGGVAAGDYDGDGDVDVYVVGGDATPNQLFENRGGNRFVDVALQTGLHVQHKGSGPAFADFDGDGDLDLFVGCVEGSSMYVFLNRDGVFEDVTEQSGISMTALNTVSASFGDFDLDGDLDLFTSHWGNPRTSDTEHFWINRGGFFESGSVATGIADTILKQHALGGIPGAEWMDYTFSPNFADINNDGYPDLLVTGDFGTSQVYLNDRNGGFDLVTDPAVIVDQNGMGAAVADYDNDGDLDWFVSAIYGQSPSGNVISIGNRLYQNQGDGTFEDVSFPSGVTRGGWGWGASFADFNNDGHLDIFHTAGWDQDGIGLNNYKVDPVKLFMSNGDGVFIEKAASAKLFSNGQGRGVVIFDSDQDGDLDILITNNDQSSIVLYRNDTPGLGNYLNVALVGPKPNTRGVGARIYVAANRMTQMRELSNGSNYASHNPYEEHFGLGAAEMIHELRVLWPDGTTQILQNVLANQRVTIRHPDAASPNH